jgi:peptide/nickel transport system permease protein
VDKEIGEIRMKLATYILQRLLLLIIVVWGVVTMVFVISRVLPGNPAEMLVADWIQDVRVIREYEIKMGLDKPIYQQYFIYLGQILQGDLGIAWHTSQPVLRDFMVRLPATVELALASMIFSLVISIPIGVYSATKRGGIVDQFGRFLSLIGVSVPSFFLALLLVFIFFYYLHWAPAPLGRIGINIGPPQNITGFYILDSILTFNLPALIESVRYMMLPMLCMSTANMAVMTRMSRSSMLEVLRSDYITTAREKGLSEKDITWKHAFRNALMPISTLWGLELGSLIGGSVLVETIFAWPGMGKYVTDSILFLDYAPVEGFVLLSALIYCVSNLIIDILYFMLDPRIRYD